MCGCFFIISFIQDDYSVRRTEIYAQFSAQPTEETFLKVTCFLPPTVEWPSEKGEQMLRIEWESRWNKITYELVGGSDGFSGEGELSPNIASTWKDFTLFFAHPHTVIYNQENASK